MSYLKNCTVVMCLCVVGCAREAAAPKPVEVRQVLETHDLVDLTHTLDSAFPFIPVPGVTFPFALEPIATLAQHGVAANTWRIHEHIGTQIDAPSHFANGGVSLEGIVPAALIAPIAVIDFRPQATANRDAALTVGDVERWEAEHGRLARGTVVALYTGWDRHLGEASYVGLDAAGVKHFPGFGPEVVRFLTEQRDVWGVAVDTLSFDPGPDGTYEAHRVLLGAGKWALEALANLERVPSTGATVFIGAPKVAGATGGLARVLALVPKGTPVNAALQGYWRSEHVETTPTGAGPMHLTRALTFAEDRWTLDVTTFEDESGRAPLARLRHAGRVDTWAVRALSGTTDADFHFDQRTLTPMSNQMAQTLASAGCGSAPWSVGVSQDVSAGGCLAIRMPSMSTCPTEHDVVKIAGNRLYLGARPSVGSLCDEASRPMWAGDAALTREK